MKQKPFLIVFIIILVLLSIYFAFFRKQMAYDEKMEIVLQDTNQITEIIIAQSGHVVNLSKLDNKWLVDGVYNANEFAIKRLFRIFKNLEISTLLPEIEHDSVIKQLEESGISISFLEGKKTKASYIIGTYDEISKSTILIMEDRLPVYVTAPGLASNIQKIVEADPIYWRNKRIFQLESSEISSVSFSDFKKVDNSFRIEIQDGDYKLFDGSQKTVPFDKEKVSRYISYYKNIEFDSIASVFPQEKTDSIINEKGNYLIKVKSINGKEFELKLIPISIQNDEAEYDLNKAFGILNNRGPIVFINYFAVDPIIKEISYFKK